MLFGYGNSILRNKINKKDGTYSYFMTSQHSSCDYLTPNQAHLQSENLKKRWKNYNKKYNIEKAGV